MNDKKISKVVVASEQAVYLRGMTSLILSMRDMTLVGAATCGVEAVQACQMSQPDLALLDLRDAAQAHEMSGELRQRCPGIKIILLVDMEEEDNLPDTSTDAEDPGLYYLSRDVTEEEFKAALEQIRQTPQRQTGDGSRVFASAPQTGDGETLEPFEAREAMLTRELTMAGKIQADILPEEAPAFPGWDLSVKLLPARETSGDFYDFIPLTGRKWGLVIADVTDKGMGAALFMALSSTLIRTYSVRFPTLPGMTMSTVSQRILSDTRGTTFVTAFYGILEPDIGRLVYANAGHPPGYLICVRKGKTHIDSLRPTGMALGVSEDARWTQKMVRFAPGDFLVLYTDGVTEAQNPQGAFFGDDGVLDAILEKQHGTAHEIQKSLLDAVTRFVGRPAPQDDVAIIVIKRRE